MGRSQSNSSPTVSSSRFLPFLNGGLVACRREVFFYYVSRESGARKCSFTTIVLFSYCAEVSRVKAQGLLPYPFLPFRAGKQ